MAKDYTAALNNAADVFDIIVNGGQAEPQDNDAPQESTSQDGWHMIRPQRDSDPEPPAPVDVDINAVSEVNNIQKRPGGRPRKYEEETVRVNLKIPVSIRRYMNEAAARESTPDHLCTVTEYILDLIRADMEKHRKG